MLAALPPEVFCWTPESLRSVQWQPGPQEELALTLRWQSNFLIWVSSIPLIFPCLKAGKALGDYQAGRKKGWSLPFAAPRPKSNTREDYKPQAQAPASEKPAPPPKADDREAKQLAGCSINTNEEETVVSAFSRKLPLPKSKMTFKLTC